MADTPQQSQSTQLDQKIQDHINDPDIPRYVITLTNVQGSTSNVDEGIRLTLRNSNNITIDGNKGRNEFTFVKCSNVTLKNIQKAIIRFDDCNQVKLDSISSCEVLVGKGTIGASASGGKITMSDGQSDNDVKLSLTDSTLVNCEFKNKLTIDGGQAHIENCQFSDELDIQNHALVSIVNTKLKKVQGKDSIFQLHSISDDTEFDLTGCVVQLDACSSIKSFSAKQSKIVATDATIKEKASMEESVLNLKDVTFEQDADIKQSNGVLSKITAKQGIKAFDSTITVADTSAQSSVTASGGAIHLENAEFKGDLSVSDCAFSSYGGQFQGKVSVSNSTIESFKDAFKSDFSLDSLIGNSSVFKANVEGNTTIKGNQKSRLASQENTFKKLDISELGKFESHGDSTEDISLSKLKYGVFVNCSTKNVDASDCGIIQIAQGSNQDLTFDKIRNATLAMIEAQNLKVSDSGIFDASDSTFQDMTFDQVRNAALAMIQGQNLDLKTCGSFNMQDSSVQDVSENGSQHVVFGKVDGQQFSFSSIKNALLTQVSGTKLSGSSAGSIGLDLCDFDQVDISSTGSFTNSGGSISKATLDKLDFAGVRGGIDQMDVTGSQQVYASSIQNYSSDGGSNVLSNINQVDLKNGHGVLANISQATVDSCVATASSSYVSGSGGSTITANDSRVKNSGGLTVGSNIKHDQQSNVFGEDGSGNIYIEAEKNIYIKAKQGNVETNAQGDITEQAQGDIKENASGNIIEQASQIKMN
jgi:hypothetical protein